MNLKASIKKAPMTFVYGLCFVLIGLSVILAVVGAVVAFNASRVVQSDGLKDEQDVFARSNQKLTNGLNIRITAMDNRTEEAITTAAFNLDRPAGLSERNHLGISEVYAVPDPASKGMTL